MTSDFSGNTAPTSLSGTQVTINGLPAFVNYISPGLVDVQVPSGIGTGIQLMTVTAPGGTSPTYQIVVNPIAPGFDAPASFKIGGIQYVVALFNSDGAYVLPTGAIPGLNSRPAKAGDIITLYGIGFGAVTPNVPAGQIDQQQNSLVANFNISIGGMPASVPYAGLSPQWVGLYQFDVVVPPVAAGNAVPVTFTLGGIAGTQTLNIAVQ